MRLIFRFFFLFCLPVITSASRVPYVIQSGTPVALQNFVHSEAGCNWSGVGGQVFNQMGLPVSGLIVKLSGTIEGNQVLIYTVTGSSLQFGPGGFDFTLSDHPVESQSRLYLQLFDLVGLPLSGQVTLNTSNNCAQNLLLINLVEKSLDILYYFPFVSR